MSRDDIETNFIEELGLSDDSDLDPDFVPHSEKDNLCESPTLSRSQRAQARQAEKDGKEQAVVDATKLLMQKPKKHKKYKVTNSRNKTSFVWQFFEKNISVDGEKCIDVVKCKHCDYELKYNTSTSGMSYHIRNKPRQLYKDTHIAAPGHTVKESIKGKSVMKSYTHAQRKLSKDSSEWNNLSRLLARFVIIVMRGRTEQFLL